MGRRRFLASMERERGGREKCVLGGLGVWSLTNHSLNILDKLAGLLLPGWLRSDITGSRHLLAVNSGRQEEARAGEAQTAFLKEIASGVATEHWGTQGGRRVGSVPGSTLRWEVGLSRESHERLFFCHLPGSRNGLMFFC